MKLVFSKEEVAAALNKSPRRFDELRPALEAMGFPRPVPGLGASWSIINVMNWVNTPSHHPAACSSHTAGLQGGSTDTATVLPPLVVVHDDSVSSIQKRLEARYGGGQ